MTAIHKGLHQEDIMALRSFNYSHRLGVIERNWLLTEHMLPRFGCFDGPFSIHRMRSRKIDGLYILVGQHSFVAAITMGTLPGCAEAVCGSLATAANSDKCSRLRLRHARSKYTRNPSRPNNP